jgi:hypothetical protein
LFVLFVVVVVLMFANRHHCVVAVAQSIAHKNETRTTFGAFCRRRCRPAFWSAWPRSGPPRWARACCPVVQCEYGERDTMVVRGEERLHNINAAAAATRVLADNTPPLDNRQRTSSTAVSRSRSSTRISRPVSRLRIRNRWRLLCVCGRFVSKAARRSKSSSSAQRRGACARASFLLRAPAYTTKRMRMLLPTGLLSLVMSIEAS